MELSRRHGDDLADEQLIRIAMEYSLNSVDNVTLDDNHIVNCLYCYEAKWYECLSFSLPQKMG